MKSAEDRFMAKVSPEPNSGCWLWTGGVASNGYGMFWFNGKVDTAPRQSYRMFCGEIVDDLHIMHKCDVKLCVNPDHLSLGTNAENTFDKQKKGRAAKKLTPAEVLKMRSMATLSKRKLAKEFDVDRRMVQFILRGRNWSHI